MTYSDFVLICGLKIGKLFQNEGIVCFLKLFVLCMYIYREKEDITWPRGDMKFLFDCWKIFHEWAQITREIFFFNTKREISYLQANM